MVAVSSDGGDGSYFFVICLDQVVASDAKTCRVLARTSSCDQNKLWNLRLLQPGRRRCLVRPFLYYNQVKNTTYM